LQVLNMGIMIAGFAILANRISGITQQCNAILHHAEEANHQLDWLRNADVTGYQAKMLAALEAAETAQKLGESLLPYDTQINACLKFFGQMLGGMLQRGAAYRDADMFEMLLIQHAVAIVARARTQWLMIGPDAGLEALDQGRRAHAELVSTFQRMLREPGQNFSILLDMTASQRERLKQIGGLLRHVSQRLGEKREEMEACVAAALCAPADGDKLLELEAHPRAWLILSSDVEASIPATLA
jgi:hypothetical protein